MTEEEALPELKRRGMSEKDAKTALEAALRKNGWYGILCFVDETRDVEVATRTAYAEQRFGADGMRAVLMLAAAM